MLFTMLIYSLQACISYASDNWCKYGGNQNKLCGAAWKFYFSLVNKTEFEISLTERGLFFLTLIVLFILRVNTFRISRNLEKEMDEGIIDITDYSVELVGLPRNCNIREIFAFFQNTPMQSPDLKSTIAVKPRAINLLYSDIDVLAQKDIELRKQLKDYGKFTLQQNSYLTDHAKHEFLGQLHEAEDLLNVQYPYVVDESTLVYLDHKFCGKAYLSFDTQVERNAVINQIGMDGLPAFATRFLGYIPGVLADKENGNGQQLRKDQDTWFHVGFSKHPADIIWENQGLSTMSRLCRRIVSSILIVLIFAASFWTAFALKKWQISYKNGNFWISLAMTGALKLFNIVFSLAAEFTAKFEKPETKTILGSNLVWRNTTVAIDSPSTRS